jgi:hypothetical protein
MVAAEFQQVPEFQLLITGPLYSSIYMLDGNDLVHRRSEKAYTDIFHPFLPNSGDRGPKSQAFALGVATCYLPLSRR